MDFLNQVFGHQNIKKILFNQVQQNKIHHAYLFCGPVGIGKTLLAYEFSKFLLQIDSSNISSTLKDHPDLLIIKHSKNTTSFGVDQIREVKNFLSTSPYISKKKIVIIDKADLLTTPAQNAILKILEEPPSYTHIFLITYLPEKLLATIKSRVQTLYFFSPQIKEIPKMIGNHNKEEIVTRWQQFSGKIGLVLNSLNDEKIKQVTDQKEKIRKQIPQIAKMNIAEKLFWVEQISPIDWELYQEIYQGLYHTFIRTWKDLPASEKTTINKYVHFLVQYNQFMKPGLTYQIHLDQILLKMPQL